MVETKPLPKIKKNILRFEPFDNKEMKNSIGMWKTESTIFSKGGEITWDSKIKFRNLRFHILFYFFLIQKPWVSIFIFIFYKHN